MLKDLIMDNGKILTLALTLLAIAFLFWVFTQAFHLLTAPSDTLVIIGILLLCAAVAATIKLSTTFIKKMF